MSSGRPPVTLHNCLKQTTKRVRRQRLVVGYLAAFFAVFYARSTERISNSDTPWGALTTSIPRSVGAGFDPTRRTRTVRAGSSRALWTTKRPIGQGTAIRASGVMFFLRGSGHRSRVDARLSVRVAVALVPDAQVDRHHGPIGTEGDRTGLVLAPRSAARRSQLRTVSAALRQGFVTRPGSAPNISPRAGRFFRSFLTPSRKSGKMFSWPLSRTSHDYSAGPRCE